MAIDRLRQKIRPGVLGSPGCQAALMASDLKLLVQAIGCLGPGLMHRLGRDGDGHVTTLSALSM